MLGNVHENFLNLCLENIIYPSRRIGLQELTPETMAKHLFYCVLHCLSDFI